MVSVRMIAHDLMMLDISSAKRGGVRRSHRHMMTGTLRCCML